MQILEQFIRGKKGRDDLCEDMLFVSDAYIAIVDGATSKTKNTYNGKTTGRIAAELIYAALNSAAHDVPAHEMMAHLNTAFTQWYSDTNITTLAQHHPHERATATVAIYSAHHREVWLLGDCAARFGNTVFQHEKYVDEVTSSTRALYITEELARGMTIEALRLHDTGRTYIEPLLVGQQLFQNAHPESPFYYAQLDGFFTDTSAIHIHPVPNNVLEVILASDGYLSVLNTLAESEAYLAQTLHEDPLMYKKHKQPKGLIHGNESFDDRAFIRFKI